MSREPRSGVLVRYLLGEMSEEERIGMEQKYFADDEFFEQLVETQNDLADAYVRGELGPAERNRFERHLLTNEAVAERVAFARAFLERTAHHPAHVPRWKIAAAASIAAMATAVLFIAFWPRSREALPRESRPAPPQQRSIAPPPQTTQTKPPADIPPPRRTVESTNQASVVTVLLTPGGTREGGESRPLVLRPAPEWVRLELILQDGRYDSYAARVEDVDGRELWKETSLRPEDPPSRRVVALKVPAKLLPPGDYVILLEGLRASTAEEIGDYTFTVIAMPGPR